MQLISAVLVAVLACVALAQNYVAPDTIKGIDENSQAYQLGVWSFILFIVIGALGFYTTAGMDYSNDNLLMVEVEGKDHVE